MLQSYRIDVDMSLEYSFLKGQSKLYQAEIRHAAQAERGCRGGEVRMLWMAGVQER